MAGRFALSRLGRSALGSASRQWVQATSVRGAAQAAPAKEDEDIVVSVFKDEQKKFSSFVDATKNIPIPMSGDAAAIEGYCKKIGEIKNKLGIPSDAQRFHNTMEYQMSNSGDDVRTFVQSMEGMLGEGAFNEVMDAVEKVENESGYALTFGDNPPFLKFVETMKSVLEANGVSPSADPAKIAMEAEVARIKALSAEAQEEMEAAKKRHGLGFVNVNAAELKPTTG
ncbi:hypothetical protein BSKO_05466 [Bryopsis sp. KO-2023]|nr:hypothetical protein BSKO_05466 [Bryopsis sp. KO-2023]